jgi:glycosyltransferase involved in cell wall biosynthesis
MTAEKLGGTPDPELAFEYFSSSRSPWGPELLQQIRQSDVVNLHWVSEYLDFRLLGRLAGTWPVVWTLHDLNPLTGGCHFDDGCEGFASACEECPQISRRLSRDRSARAMRSKRAALETVRPGRLSFVAPSAWMARQLGRSSLFGEFGVTVIPNGIEPALFGQVGRSEARRRLGVPDDRTWFLFVADWLTSRRKGGDLVRGLECSSLGEAGAGLLLCGQGPGDPTSPHVVGLGQRPEAEMATVYAAADAVVVPSRQDNFPNVVLEAMASGRAVIATDAGGIPEMLDHGVDGLLCPADDVASLSRSVRELARSGERRLSMGEAARRKVEARYTLRIQADAYAALFRDVVGADGPGREPPNFNRFLLR